MWECFCNENGTSFCMCCCHKPLNVHVFYPIVLLHSIIGYWHHYGIRQSVCNAVHCGSQGRCTGLYVIQASHQASSHLSLQTLLLRDVSFCHKTHRKKRVEENAGVSFFATDNQACTGRDTCMFC